MTKTRLAIDGMHCNGCVARVSAALKEVPGVSLDLVEVGAATVQLDDTRTSPAALIEALKKVGYEAHACAAIAGKGGCCCDGSCQPR